MATKITSSSNITIQPSSSTSSTQYFNTNFSVQKESNLTLYTKSSQPQMYTLQSSNFKTELASLDSKTNPINKFKNINDNNQPNRKPFDLNDLVWAKFKNFPWWPCQIVRDLIDNNEYFKIIENKEMYLVEMIGTYKERAWVKESSLFKYNGIESFKTYAQDQVDRAETKLDKERLAERFQLKVSLNRRDDWDNAITQADLIIKQSQEIKFNKNSLLKFKRKRDNDDEISKIIKNDDELARIKISKIESTFNLNNNFKHSNGINKSDDLIHINQEEDEYLEDEDDEVLNDNESTSDEEDSDSFQPTTIYDSEQPIQNIYTYNTNSTNNNLKNTYSDELQLHSINSIMTELENNKNKSKLIKNHRVNNHLILCETNGINPSTSISEEQQETPTSLTNNDLNDFSHQNKKKRGRKPKQTNENENSTFTSNSSNTSSNQSSPNTSRKNSADLTSSLNEKTKHKKPASLADYMITTPNLSSKLTKGHKKNELTVKSSKHFDQNHFDELLLKETKDFDFNLNDFIGLHSSSSSKNNKNMDSTMASANPSAGSAAAAETYLIDRYKYAVRHIRQGLSVEEACNKYRISKGALLKCLSGGTAPRGKKTRLTEIEENEIVEWLINNKDVKYNEAIHLVFEQVERIFQQTQRPNPFNNGKPSMDWWYDFLSRHPQIMASKPDWLRRGKVNDQYIKDVQSGQLKCTKFRRALLSAIQYIKSLAENSHPISNSNNFSITNEKSTVKKETSLINNNNYSSSNINRTSDLFAATDLPPCLKSIKTNKIKTKLSSSTKANNNGIKTSHSYQTKQRQTMNSISTTIDLPIKQIKKPDLNSSKLWETTNKTDNNNNLIENTPSLVDYTDEDIDSLTNILRTENTKMDSIHPNHTDLSVRFDNFLTSNSSVQSNLLIGDDLNIYDTNESHHSLSTTTNPLQNLDSSIYLNDNYSSIHDDDEQTEDDEFDDPHASPSYIEVDPSCFI